MAKYPDSGRSEGVPRPWRGQPARLAIPVLFAAMAVLWATDLRTNGSEETGSSSGSHQGRRTEGQSAWPDEKLRRRLEEADLAALTHMHALSARLLGAGGLEPLLQEIMDVAVAIVGAERGTLQLIKGDSLRIVAHYGHQRPFLEFFASAEARASVCGESMKRGQRVIVEDVEHSPLFADTESLKVLREAGVRAVQSTPLLTRQGKLLGILTTQWAVPHVPDEHDLWRIDLLARQGADLIEHKRAEEAASRSQRTFFELVERPPFGIYIVDSQFRIAHMNAGSQTGAFRNVRPVIGRDFAEAMRILWPEPVAVGIIAVFRHTLETGEPYYSPRFVNPRHDVETVEAYEWELHRMTLPDGQYGVICYYFDSTELREAEEARRVSEQRVTSILETMSDCFVTFDRDWRYTYINAAAAKAFHMTPQQLLGTTLWEVWPAAYDLPLGVSFRRSLAENISIQFEQFYPGPLNRWFECRCHPTPEGLATFFSDITERKQAEAALRQSEDRFRTMANAIPQLAWIARADGYIYWYNQRWYDYTGTTPEQMEGWGWQSVHDPQELPTVLERWKSSIATGQPFDMIFPLRGADGIFRPFLTRRDAAHRRTGPGPAVVRDQYRRVGTEARKRRCGRARRGWPPPSVWPTLAPGSGILPRTRPVGRRRRSGSSPSLRGPLQQHRVDFISRIVPEDRQRVDQALSDALSGTRDYGLDYRIRLPDGRERVIHAQAQVLRSSDGRPVMMYGTVQDITERKQAEETLRELNATLESKVAQRTAELEYRARQLQKLTLELSQAEERERRRIAVILHEDLQQQIAGAKFHLSLVRNRTKDDRLRADVEDVDAMLKEAIEKIPQPVPRSQSRRAAHERPGRSPAVAGQSGAGPAGSECQRGCLGRHDAAIGSAGDVPVPSRPGDAVQRGQARAGPRGRHSCPADRALRVPVPYPIRDEGSTRRN